MRMIGLLAALVMGCGSADSGDDSSPADDTGSGGDGGSPDGISPWIEEGTVTCTKGSQSSGFIFVVEVQAHDPQGDQSLGVGGSVAAWDGDAAAFDEPLLVCDAEGACIASWSNGQYGGVTCAQQDDYAFTAIVQDEEGNASEAFTLTWSGG